MDISRPFLSDSQDMVSPGLSHTRENLTTDILDRIDERLDRSMVHLSPSSELDPFLRTFYTFDPSNHFNANLRSFQRFGNDPSTSTVFVETPHRVTTALAETLVPKPDSNEALFLEMKPFKDKLFGLLTDLSGRFTQSVRREATYQCHQPSRQQYTACRYPGDLVTLEIS